MLRKGEQLKYLLDYRDGKIKQGLEIGCELDKHIVFKPKQLNIILGMIMLESLISSFGTF